jgi:hypothetical protein
VVRQIAVAAGWHQSPMTETAPDHPLVLHNRTGQPVGAENRVTVSTSPRGE